MQDASPLEDVQRERGVKTGVPLTSLICKMIKT